MRESELKILESLARYKYLTTKQMMTLKILSQRANLYPRLKNLLDGKKALIKKNVFGVSAQGRLEDFYFLTNYGKDFLIENLDQEQEEIKLPTGTSSLFSRDYKHRLECINFYIYFDLWAKENHINIIMLNYYFDKVGDNRKNKNLRALNRIEVEQTGGYIIPDIVVKFLAKRQSYIFLV